MKASFRGTYSVAPAQDLPDTVKQEFLTKLEPTHLWIALREPIQQDGNSFSYVVAPFILSHELKFEQKGAGVLCETEAEAKETFANLVERSKKHLIAAQAPGFGMVGWAMNLRRLINEIGVRFKNLPDGTTLWLAYERETDQDTLEVKVLRHKMTNSEEEANTLAKEWLAEYSAKKQGFFDAVNKNITPPPPPRCTALTKQEIEDLGNAKMKALQRQWPHCFNIFEAQKSNPRNKIPDHQIEEAYYLDLVESGVDLGFVTSGQKLRPDMNLISSLHKAAQNYARRGKSKIIDLAIYLIAFNWEIGWCYLSDKQIAEKLSELLEANFTPGQVKKYRLNTLELVAKHLPGPPQKIP